MTADLRIPLSALSVDDDAELAWRVIAPAYDAVDLGDEPEAVAAGVARLTPGQRALLALHWCVAEVQNGGFDQFFTNPSGALVDEALDGFARIGATETNAVLREARALFDERPPDADPDDPSFDEAEHEEAFDAYLDRFDALQERFDGLVDRELYPRAAAYVRAHPAEFAR